MSRKCRGEVELSLVLAEDDDDLRRILVGQFSGIPKLKLVSAVSNGQEVLAMLETKRVDIALLDVEMPVMDGVECAKRISKRWPSTTIIMLTAFERPERMRAAVAAGARGFLTKDMEMSEVVNAIEKVHFGQQVLSPTAVAAIMDASRHASAHDQSAEAWLRAVEELSPARREVYELLKQGLSMREIAEQLCKAESTVRITAAKTYAELSCRSQADLVRQATLYETRYKSLL